MTKNTPLHLIPGIITIIMLLIAIGNMPYSYYQLLRLVVSTTLVFYIIQLVKNNNPLTLWSLVATTYIYNPIIPLHLTRETWTIINLLTIPTIIYNMRKVTKNNPQNKIQSKAQDNPQNKDHFQELTAYLNQPSLINMSQVERHAHQRSPQNHLTETTITLTPEEQSKRFHSTAEDQLNFDITLAEIEYHPEDHKQLQSIEEWLNSQ